MNPNRWSLALLSALLSACAARPSSAPSTDVELPPQWRQGSSAADSADAVSRDWWTRFGSAELDALIARAQTQSFDLAASIARLRQAQANARIAGATLWPQIEADVQGSRSRGIGGDTDEVFLLYGTGLSASYEFDFWGRNRARRDSAVFAVQASLHDRDTVRLTLTSNVASGWIEIAALRERIEIADQNLHSAERLLGLVEARSRAGAATPLELAQQRGLVAAQRRGFADLHQRSEDARVNLAILLGHSGNLDLRQSSVRELALFATDPGLPSELLTRRPDIARAEADLMAADADVFAARRALLPSFTLNAGIGTGGDRLGRIFDDPIYSLAAALTAPIFNAGRLAAGRDFALARREELLAQYRAAIVSAFGDVQRALNAISGLEAQAEAQAEQLRQAERALTLAESRYRAGAETLLTLLDAQRSLYSAQDEAVQIKCARLLAQVALFVALGGGWNAAIEDE